MNEIEDFYTKLIKELEEFSDVPYEKTWRSVSDIDQHWHRVHSDGRIISFCKVMDKWEFHLADGDGYIKHIISLDDTKSQVKGYGRASQVAKLLARMPDREFETSRLFGSWSMKSIGV